MSKRHYALCLTAIFFLLFSCSKEESPGLEQKKEFQDVYELSEMAALMEDMYTHLKDTRPKVLNGELPGEFPKEILEIHTAKMTESFEHSYQFDQYARILVDGQQKLYDKDTTGLKEKYNQTVLTCLACHQSDYGCPGPVTKIRKLLIQ